MQKQVKVERIVQKSFNNEVMKIFHQWKYWSSYGIPVVLRVVQIGRDIKRSLGSWWEGVKWATIEDDINIFLRFSLHANEMNSFPVSILDLWPPASASPTFASSPQTSPLGITSLPLTVQGFQMVLTSCHVPGTVERMAFVIIAWLLMASHYSGHKVCFSFGHVIQLGLVTAMSRYPFQYLSKSKTKLFSPNSNMEDYKSRITSNFLATTWSLNMNQNGGAWSWEIEKA